MNLPNRITFSRIFLIPVYIILMYLQNKWSIYVAGVMFIIASATDSVDGYVARKYEMITDLGKFLDPLADKLLVLSSVIMFVHFGRIAAWAAIIIIGRELIITIFRGVAALDRRVIAADKYGKLKTIFQLVALSVMHFDKLSVILYVSASVLFYISVILAVFSAVNYIITNKDVFKGGQA